MTNGDAQKRALRFCLITTFYPPYLFGGDALLRYFEIIETVREKNRAR